MPSSRDYAPYFRNGLLYLPPMTVELLVEAGLDKALAHRALEGLALDDQREDIGLISRCLENALEKLEEDSQAFRTLSSDEAQFMITGKPPAQV